MTATETLKYRIVGMDCAACATKIENAVSRLPGVAVVGVSVAAGTMTVTPDGAIAAGAVERQVKTLGYSIAPAGATAAARAKEDHGHDHEHGHDEVVDGPWWRTRKAVLIFVCAAALAGAYLVGLAFPEAGHWAFVAAMVVGLVPIARRAIVAG